MENLVIIGASGHGKVVADIASNIYKEIYFLDDDERKTNCLGFPIRGKCSEAVKYISNADLFVAIGNAEARQKIQSELLDAGANIPVLKHPNVVIGKNVTVGVGTVIMAGAVINADSQIGQGCIINTCSSIDHDCKIGDFVHVAVGAHVAGTVSVGNRTWLGAGCTVSNNVSITNDCMIGAGGVVVKDIVESGTYVGVPAGKR